MTSKECRFLQGVTRGSGRGVAQLLAAALVLGLSTGATAAPTQLYPRQALLQAGDDHTLLRKADGTLWSWGGNIHGELGLGDTTTRTTPTQLGIRSDWAAIATGVSLATTVGNRGTSFGLRNDGLLLGWGMNSDGRLALGDTIDRTTPAAVIGDTTWKQIANTDTHTAAIRADGTLWTWGANSEGQLGLGDTASRTSPTQVGTDTDWAMVSPNGRHTLAIKSNGTLWAWGYNVSGQLGLADTAQRIAPVQVGSDNDWAFVSGGTVHSLAIKTDGTLWAWGSGAAGQHCRGPGNYNTPAQIGGANRWVSVSGGYTHTLAVKTDGTLWSCGSNYYGEKGRTSYDPLGQVGTATDWAYVRAGNYFSMGMKTDGSIWAWGTNVNSQLGLGDTTQRNNPTQLETASHIPLGRSPERRDFGTVGHGLTGQSQVFTLTNNSGGSDFLITAIGVNGPYTVSNNCPSILPNGSSCTVTTTLKTVRVGDASGTIVVLTPSVLSGAVVMPLFATITSTYGASVAAGAYHSLLRKADRNLWGWGNNPSGEIGLGDGAANPVTTPTQISTDWRAMAAGNGYNIALAADGSLWGWGVNGSGQLALGAAPNVPTQISADTTWRAVSTGVAHTVALKADGTIWSWGYNYYGQLGHGNVTNLNVTTKIGSDTDWVAVSAGNTHTLALKANGTLWAWGNNNYGQLGLNDTTVRKSPTQVGSDTDWVAIAGGGIANDATPGGHSLAIKANGTLWTWGRNNNGQLGHNDTTDRWIPTQVGIDTNWESVRGGGYFSIARKTTQHLYAWGLNTNGQLGVGDTTNRLVPTQVLSTYGNWLAFDAGFRHVVARKTDGSVWSWGDNYFAQLGLGDTNQRNSPTQINAATHVPAWTYMFQWDFGARTRGATGITRSGGLQNLSATDNLIISSIGTRGPYEVTNTNCPATLTPGSSCSLVVTLKTDITGDFAGALAVTSPSVTTGEITIPFKASISGVWLTHDSIKWFGLVGLTAVGYRDITLTNRGTEAVAINSITAVGDSAYTVSSHTCLASLAVGAQCTITVAFAPNRGGAFAGTIEVGTNDAITPLKKVPLRGYGDETRVLLNGNAKFGDVNIGTAPQRQISITNGGVRPLNIVSITRFGSAAYAVVGNNCPATLEAGSRCTLTVSFTPTANTSYTGRIEIATNDPLKPLLKLGLRGTGVPAP